MSEEGFDSGGSGLRPERLGGDLRLRPERLGAEATPAASTPQTAADGWTFDPAGTTAGRILHFTTPEDMRRFVADLRSAVESFQPDGSSPTEGSLTLMIFLAGHRISG